MSIMFGRFTDAFKPKIQLDRWNECEKLYDEKKYFDSYKVFFDYMKDSESENVFYTLDDQMLKFQFIQGSKEIRGYFDGKNVSAIAVIAGYEKINVAVFRRLLEMNYSLYYSRFAIKDNKLLIKFSSNVMDCPPNKLYYGLRELSIRADKQDDILISEFKSLISAESKSEQYTASEIDAMKKYFHKWISDTLLKVSSLNKEQFSGGISYILLNLLYRIDYLLMPQGILQNDLELMSWNYFNNKDATTSQRISILEEEIKKLSEYDDAKLDSNFYKVKSTFGLLQPAGKQAVDEVINSNIQNIKWYLDNEHKDIALNILEYIVGYSLFTYGLNKSLRKILGLMMQIINQEYTGEINRETEFMIQDSLNRDFIVKEFSDALSTDISEFPELKMNFENIKFDSRISFIKSTLEEILKLNYKN